MQNYRELYLSKLSDKNFLYFDACETIPVTQRPICDGSSNWKKLDPEVVGCRDVQGCDVKKYLLNEEERERYFADISAKQGASISVTDKVPLSISDPVGWGPAARWPLFFLSFFLALKLGRALGEFVFLTYEK